MVLKSYHRTFDSGGLSEEGMSKKKIVHLVNGLGLDGTSKVVYDLCRADAKEYDIEVVSLTKNLALVDAGMWNPRVQVKAFNYKFNPDYSLTRYFWLMLWRRNTAKNAEQIISYIRQVNPDILHCHLQPRESLIAVLAAQGMKSRLVLTDHSPRITGTALFAFKTSCLVRLYRLVYRHFFVVAVSKAIYESQKKHRLFNPAIGHTMIHNRIDCSRFAPAPKRAATPLRVIYVARMEPRKGHELLLRAWINMQECIRAELILLGSGALENSLRGMIQGKDLANRVIFAGNQSEVVRYLRSAHVGVFPSELEGLPIALLEKMACALPVVASDIPAVKEVITDRVNGLLFKVNSVEDLQQKLNRILTDEKLRNTLGANARHTAVDRFDSSGLIDDYKKVYQSLI